MITLRPLAAADIPFGMRLKQQAGWNQVEPDWRRFLDLEPAGCFLAAWAGRAAGVVTTCVFGDVAWVAMVLVDPALRRRGIGTALLKQALAYLGQREVASVRLDATPLGRPLYETLGFEAQFTLARYEGVFTPAGGPAAAVEPVPGRCLAAVCRLDREVTRTDRGKLLRRLWAEGAGDMRLTSVDGRVAGYLSARPGSDAWFVGPCLAEPDVGNLLLADAARRYAGRRVYLDIPTDNRPATAAAERLGLVPCRQLLRMCRGTPVREQVERLWASSGPEKG